MSPIARTHLGSFLETVCLDRPFSNFEFVEKIGGNTGLRRIFSQARRNGCRTLIVEDVSDADDICIENDGLKAMLHLDSFEKTTAIRLSFFNITFNGSSCPEDIGNDNFIGYAILRTVKAPTFKRSWVYESVIRPERIANNYIRKAPSWKCSIIGKQFTIRGYLYSQQNGITNCCAHVALRTAVSTFAPNGDMLYNEMNNIIGGFFGNGLTSNQMIKILEEAGASCFVGNFDASQLADATFSIPFQKYIYGSIESGFPAIIFFGVGAHGQYHAIPAIGHTFNQDSWVPRAESHYFSIGEKIRYIPSEYWLSTFICHDDNFGSNYCIPRHYLHTSGSQENCLTCKQGVEQIVHQGCVCHVIGTMPNFLKINPIEAEVIGADFLFALKSNLPADTPWAMRLGQYAERNQLVLRPILVNTSAYIDHLSRIKGWQGQSINNKENFLDTLSKYLGEEWFWMVELSVSELFAANKRKVGEVLIKATTAFNKDQLFYHFALARLPRYFSFYKEHVGNSPSFIFIPSGIEDHVELFGQEELIP